MNLPRLPVPLLSETLNRYLTSIKPFLLEDERKGGIPFSEAFESRQKLADDFQSSIGSILQDRLIALDDASPHNWLEDNFWTNVAYLSWRAPLLVNSNWWLAFLDDPLIPKSDVESDLRAGGITKWQIRRAAWLLHRILEFKDKLASNELHSSTTKTGVWMQESTAKLFNVARLPMRDCDVLSQVPSHQTPCTRDIYVTIHNYFYLVTVYGPSGALLDVGVLESRLKAAAKDAASRIQQGHIAPPIGLLSADNRDSWATNLQRLYQISPVNKATHDSIVQSLLGLSLDDTVNCIPSSHPLGQQADFDGALHAIRGTPQNISNRIFDKPFTLIVDPAARAGAMGEHSVVDALVPSIVAEYGIVEGIDSTAFPSDMEITPEVSGWSRLDWVVDQTIQTGCNVAREGAEKVIRNSDDSVLWFEEYGADWMRDTAKMSPDPFVQMALQLAWYYSRQEFTATYETALTRNFAKGRTETIRSFTTESREWVLSMSDPTCNYAMRLDKLRKAIARHTRLTREACLGKGIDRHFLGLQLVMHTTRGERSPLFEDELFTRSNAWKLSTSGLSAGHLFIGTGFGAAYGDGYGINYLIGPNRIKFGIESKHSSALTSTFHFQNIIQVALQEMRELCLTHPADFASPHL